MPAPARQQTPFDYWISFWPAAPLFGVKWRFENLTPGFPFFRPVDVMAQMTVASAREVGLAASERAEVTVDVAEEVADAAGAAAEAVSFAIRAEPDAQPASTAAGTGALRPALLFDTAPVTVDDLKRIKGVGPKLEAMLNGMGIYRFDQIAAMTEHNLQWIDDNLTAFRGRPFRDDWVAQARALA